jgi:hypothetical protein
MTRETGHPQKDPQSKDPQPGNSRSEDSQPKAHPSRYSSRKEWIDSLDHDYMGACPDEINGYDARDPECPACRHIERWDQKHEGK